MEKYTKLLITQIIIYNIGSTTQALCARMAGHKRDYNKYLSKVSTNKLSSFEILKNNNYTVVLLEKYPCDCLEELLKRERHYYDMYECVNKLKPYETVDEYKSRKKIAYIKGAEKRKMQTK